MPEARTFADAIVACLLYNAPADLIARRTLLMKFDNQNRQWHSGISRCSEKG